LFHDEPGLIGFSTIILKKHPIRPVKKDQNCESKPVLNPDLCRSMTMIEWMFHSFFPLRELQVIRKNEFNPIGSV
jgi:hypothetical protein